MFQDTAAFNTTDAAATNKPAVQTSGADPSRCKLTNKLSPPISNAMIIVMSQDLEYPKIY